MRRVPIGAEVLPTGGVHFRVWAPGRKFVEVAAERAFAMLEPEAGGYYSGTVSWAKSGMRYRLRLDREGEFPDPASRYQPDGPHGPSQIVDPEEFRWTDDNWAGCELAAQVLYEMHIGTFTREGTWRSAGQQLPALARLGITCLEVMPVADFPGQFGWGYDGVNLFAPTRLYGSPDDFRWFVNQAHELGLGVILDVVYNHFGPDGNYIRQFCGDYFTSRHKTDWGEAINFYGKNSKAVREFFIANAGYWISEFHLDGIRLDATQDIHDYSDKNILTEIAAEVRRAAGSRSTIVIAENEPQESRLIRSTASGGYGLDALWNDDLHHSAMVALTGQRDAYYSDYRGEAQEFVSAAKYGYLYQGQHYTWQQRRRGTPALDVPPARFVAFIQNHDQVANSVSGQRAHMLSAPGMFRALTAYLLLIPATPMLFQGQEFAASTPFLYFADHQMDLGSLVWSGRKEFLSQWRRFQLDEMQQRVQNPSDPRTFEVCKLDHAERGRNGNVVELHRDLIRLRREDPVFRAQRQGALDGAVLNERAFVLRFLGQDNNVRLLVVNFGPDLLWGPAPEPLLAPPSGCEWLVLLSTEDSRYGGTGTPRVESGDGWHLPAYSAIALAPGVAR